MAYAVITGGSSGMGYALAKALLAEGYTVVILSRSAERCDLRQKQGCLVKNTDVKSLEALRQAGEWVAQQIKGQKIDVLINCAGTGYELALETTTEEDYVRVFDTNVKGMIFATQVFLPQIRPETGIICNFSSIAGIKGFAKWSLYCASKFAVEGFTQSLRHEVRPLGIRVISVRPGSVDTPFYKHLPQEEKKLFIQPATVAQLVTPLLKAEKNACVEDIVINNAAGDL